MVRKYLYGGPGYFLGGVTAKDLDKGTKKVAKGFNWLMGKVGDIFNTVVTAGASSDFGQTSPFALMDRKTIAKGREQVRQKAKKALEENAVYVSPSSHVAAWIQGSWNPKVGALFLASDPRIQALGAIGDLVTLKYTPKAVKVGKNLSLILKKRSVISKVNKELKKGIKENSVLESYNEVPANKDIGTAYDYLDFLDNIYPNSKLNATFYHGGPKGITQFKTAKELGSTNKGINSGTKDYGIYLADDKSLALYYAETNKKNNRHLYNVRVNVQNPMRYETNNWYMDKMSTTGDLRFRPGEITLKWYDRLNLKNYDGIYHTKSKNAFDNGELVMFDKNNIHIMGTPEESLMFRNWKLNPLYSSKPLLEEIPLTPEQYERSFLNYAKAAKPGLFFAGLASTPPALIWYNNYLKSKTANARKWKHLDGGIIIAEKGIKAGLKAKQNLTKRKAPDWDNLDRGYRYLTQDMKLPHDLAIAIMGNVVEESQGNYKAVLKNGGGRGLIQWDGQPAPTGRYGLWGKIWASVAKPANVYDSKTDTMKNYWAPWGGLKGEQVRLKFINAPLKTKTKIYAESYLRPGKPRIKDRQLSAMLLDSIYNPRIKNIIIDKEGGIIKAEDGTKFNWQSALTNVGTNLFNSYLQSRVQNNKINSEAEVAKAENEVDLNQYFWDIYLQELAKALLEEELKSKAISAMNDTVINSSPLVTLKIAYDKASKSYGNLKANLDARNKAIDEQAKAAKSSVITDAVSGVIQNGLGMLKDYYGSKNNNTSTTNTSTTSNSYFDNYVNTKYKKFGTFNSDGSMNMLGGTFTIKDGYKPNQPQLFNYQTPKLNV